MNKVLVLIMLFSTFISKAQSTDLPKSRPHEQGKPTEVKVALYVLDIEGIDNKKQSFTLDMIMRFKWSDPRLSNEQGMIPLNTIWHPNVQIYNLRNVETRFAESCKNT